MSKRPFSVALTAKDLGLTPEELAKSKKSFDKEFEVKFEEQGGEKKLCLYKKEESPMSDETDNLRFSQGSIGAAMGHEHKNASGSQWTTLKEVLGYFACAAVKISPYPCPDNLEKVLFSFHDRIRPEFDDQEMALLSLDQIGEIVRAHALSLPEVQKWNNRKNGKDGHQFISSFSPKPDPDDDFIDLEALVQNVCCLIRDDRRIFSDFNDRFEKEWAERNKEGESNT